MQTPSPLSHKGRRKAGQALKRENPTIASPAAPSNPYYAPPIFEPPYMPSAGRGGGSYEGEPFFAAAPARRLLPAQYSSAYSQVGRGGGASAIARAHQILGPKPAGGYGKGVWRSTLRQVGKERVIEKAANLPPVTGERLIAAYDRKTRRLADPNYRAMRKELREVRAQYTLATLRQGQQPTWRYSQKLVNPAGPRPRTKPYKSAESQARGQKAAATRRANKEAAIAERENFLTYGEGVR
jgi:hypothetical protein